MEDVIINNYYIVCLTGRGIGKNRNDIESYLYTFPSDIDYLDFSLLVDFSTKCLLIKNGILEKDENIDISRFFKRTKKSFKFINYIIKIYKKCSKRSYIDIDKAKIFWNTYCIMKTIIYLQETYEDSEYSWHSITKSLPTYLTDSIYIYNNIFPTTINGNIYTIYNDFSSTCEYIYILSKYLEYIPTVTSHTQFTTFIDLLPYIHLFPVNLCIYLLVILKPIYNVEHVNKNVNYIDMTWIDALRTVVNIIKSKIYYPKNHPFIVMTDYSSGLDIKVNAFNHWINKTRPQNI